MAAQVMAKKKKVPSASTMTARKTEAPMIVARPAEEPVVVTERPPVLIDRSDIARLAFTKFAARGYAHGHAVTDWLAAEAELRAAQN
ncbi:MAG: DUF2934 domain-containing protein [Kofleriaceae bacterium]|nr:DUF2934 domain-containing protein [Kofleriaceae bacterium]